jgi:hypothetical protein
MRGVINMATKSVFRQFKPNANSLTKDRTKELISAGLHRAALNHGLDTVAKAGECSTRTLQKETRPELHTLGNILPLEPTVLWEWLSELGFKIVPKDLCMSPDMRTVTEVSQFLTAFIQALEDGVRKHDETVRLGNLVRPLIPKLSAIVAEADRHRLGTS